MIASLPCMTFRNLLFPMLIARQLLIPNIGPNNVDGQVSFKSCQSCFGCTTLRTGNRERQRRTQRRSSELSCVRQIRRLRYVSHSLTPSYSLRSNVFLGLALEKQHRNDDSERAYKTATSLKGGDPLAWQGLISLYEQQGGRKLDEYHDAASHLASVFIAVYV